MRVVVGFRRRARRVHLFRYIFSCGRCNGRHVRFWCRVSHGRRDLRLCHRNSFDVDLNFLVCGVRLVRPLTDPDASAKRAPILHPGLRARIARGYEVSPVLVVFVLKVAIAAPLLHCHVRGEQAVLEDLRVEFDLLARDGVDEGHDDLEEGIDEEGDIDNAGEPQAFGVVVLEDVEDGVCGGEGRVLAPVAEVYKESKVPKGQYRSTSLLYGSRGYVFDLLNTRFHKIHAALEHPNRKLDLTRRFCGVLTTGNHVESRFPRLIISK